MSICPEPCAYGIHRWKTVYFWHEGFGDWFRHCEQCKWCKTKRFTDAGIKQSSITQDIAAMKQLPPNVKPTLWSS